MTTRNLPIKERLMLGANVSGDEACWEWLKSISRSGYGQVAHLGKCVQAHRLSYELFCGAIPDGMFVCHHCDNRKCINPKHLFLGTAGDNNRDRHAKGRSGGGRQIGEQNPLAQITNETAIAISKAEGSLKDVANRFSVTIGLVSAIRRGRIWGQVTGIERTRIIGSDGLTPLQRDVMAFLTMRLSREPSRMELSEIADKFGWSSHVTSIKMMRRLENAGVVKQCGRSLWALA